MGKNGKTIQLALLLFALVAGLSMAHGGTAGGEKAAQDKSETQIVVDPSHAGFGTVFYVNDPAGRNAVGFSSKAPLEDIIGTTNKITGYVVFDPAKGIEGGRGSFLVPVASLDTGIPLRNEHLTGANWLDAEKHPEITFRFDEAKNVKLVKQTAEFQTYDALLVGEFNLHGQSVKLEVPARFTYMKESAKTRTRLPGDLLAGRAEFKIKLSDFGVSGPAGADLIGAKVADEIDIQVSFVSTSKATEGMAQ